MDYFALSPFYDRTCVNEVIKMQKRHGLAATGSGTAAHDVSLAYGGPQPLPPLRWRTPRLRAPTCGGDCGARREIPGIQYELMLADEPHLFVVLKVNRLSPTYGTLALRRDARSCPYGA